MRLNGAGLLGTAKILAAAFIVIALERLKKSLR